MNRCGNCTLCCKIIGVEELNKPPNCWCPFVKNRGCSVYENRPQSCRDFECLWLQSQSKSATMRPDLRPDKCKVVLTTTVEGNKIVATCDPNTPNAWRSEPMYSFLLNIAEKMEVVVRHTDKTKVTILRNMGHGVIGERVRNLTEPDEHGIQQLIVENEHAPTLQNPRTQRPHIGQGNLGKDNRLGAGKNLRLPPRPI